MGYLRRNRISDILIMTVYGIMGFFASQNTELFLITLGSLAIWFIFGYIGGRAAVRDKDKLFVDQPEDKIRYRFFYKRAVYPVSILEFFIIFTVVLGIFDFSEMIKRILQGLAFSLIFIVLNGIMILIEEYLPSNYNYNVYRASLRLATKSQKDIQNIHFLRGLKYYDKYIRIKFGLAINSVENIFNRYALLEKEDRNTLLTSLLDTEIDSLSDFKILSKNLDLSGNILTKISYAQKLKDVSSFIIPIIAVALTVAQLLFNIE